MFILDDPEQGCDGSSDLPFLPDAGGINMTQWRNLGPGNAWPQDYGYWQVFRHSDRFCNALWLDGHVDIFTTEGIDDPGYGIEQRWFYPFKP